MQYTKTFLKHPPSNPPQKACLEPTLVGLSIMQDYNNQDIIDKSHLKISYPVVQLSENRLLVYAYSEHKRKPDILNPLQKKAHAAEKFTGYLSNRSHSKISSLISEWIKAGQEFKKSEMSNKKVKKPLFTFITLTLPSKQKHTDKELKRLALNRFLIWMHRQTEINQYIWKAERQKNGNLHFHILTDSYIKWSAIKEEWNNIMQSLSYIDDFFLKFGHKNPNSTDIHSLKNIKNPAAYIAKYFSKKDENQKIDGRIWSSSKGLKNIKKFEFQPDWRFWAMLKILLNKQGVNTYKSDFCTIVQGDILQEIKEYLHLEYLDLKQKRIDDWEYLSRSRICAPPVSSSATAGKPLT